MKRLAAFAVNSLSISLPIGGYDTHSNLNAIFNTRTEELNAAVDAFVKEMKIQGIWDESITVVAATEFSRTLTTNTGAGR